MVILRNPRLLFAFVVCGLALILWAATTAGVGTTVPNVPDPEEAYVGLNGAQREALRGMGITADKYREATVAESEGNLTRAEEFFREAEALREALTQNWGLTEDEYTKTIEDAFKEMMLAYGQAAYNLNEGKLEVLLEDFGFAIGSAETELEIIEYELVERDKPGGDTHKSDSDLRDDLQDAKIEVSTAEALLPLVRGDLPAQELEDALKSLGQSRSRIENLENRFPQIFGE